MRRSITTALLAAVTAAATLALPAHAAAPTVELQPQHLARGADIAVPHVADGDFVDGARRVELPGTVARVLGPSGDDWLVATGNPDRNRNRRVVRVAVSGTVTDVLTNVDTSTVVLSADGSTLAWQRSVQKGRKVITYAASAADGTVLGSRGPTRYVSLLDVDATRVVLSAGDRVFQWALASGQTRTIVRKMAGMASIEHDLLTVYTKDPYLGGCAQLVRLSTPRVKVWTSCKERVGAFAPDGTEMVTFHILADGLGPGEVHLRQVDGTRLATYTTGWFTGWQWEAPGTVLLDVNGRRKSATVRCTLGACENATDPVKVQMP
ncbi:hypothetical protein GCM10023339_57120 [Alloalcanivorax gelatiniphagus]